MSRARVLGWSLAGMLLALAIVMLGACKSKPALSAGTDPEGEKHPRGTVPHADAGPSQVGPRAFSVAHLTDRAIGPFWARRDDKAMLAYVTTVEHVGRVVDAMPLTAIGEPRTDARAVAPASPDTNALVVRAAGGENGGFVIGWTELVDRGEALHLIAVGDDASPAGPVVELARTQNDIVWFDFVATAGGAVCVWAEQGPQGDATVLAASVDTTGKVSGAASNVARGVKMWQVAAADGGVALALATSAGELTWIRLDDHARPVGAPKSIVPAASVSGDVELASVAGGWVFAWTDRSKDVPAVGVALADVSGTVRASGKIEGRAGATLVSLASGPSGVAVAWDDAEHRARDRKRVYIARISASARVTGRPLALSVSGRSSPELVATATGFSVLYDGAPCETDTDECMSTATAPTFLRANADLQVLDRVSPALGDVLAQLAWGLSCRGDACALLAAVGQSPVDVASVSIAPRGEAQQAGSEVKPSALPEGPRFSTVSQITEGDNIADIATMPVGDGALVAVLTSMIDDPAKPTRGATLSVRALDAKGAASGAPNVISTRALSVGGVAIAPAEKPEDGAALAWVARENGDPEVHVTRLDKRGHRTNDVQLTTAKGDATDVAIARVEGGWVVVWVDGRNGNGEVYATKVGPDLSRIAREERITNAPGDASDVVAIAAKDAVWIAWSDPRENVTDGFADIYATGLSPHDAKRSTNETRVLASTAHSRSPAIVESSHGVAIAWIEQPPMGGEAATSPFLGAMIAEMDPTAKVVTGPVHLRPAGDGLPESIALVNSPSGDLRAVVARSGPVALALDALILGSDFSVARAWELGELAGPPSMDVSLAPLRDAIFFSDDGEGAHDRGVRRAIVPWP